MNEQLQRMAAETLAALQERNALPEKANSAEVRYAADYIVKKSPFQPFFAALGITKGSQIGRSFDSSRDIHFFSAVVKLYYIKWYFENDLPKFNDVQGLFKAENWTEQTFRITSQFREVMRDLRLQANASMGVGAEAKYRYDTFLHMARSLYKAPDLLSELSSAELFPDAAAIAIYARKLQNAPGIKQWLEEHSDAIAEQFMRHGLSRSLLTKLHGFAVTCKGMQKLPTLEQVEHSISSEMEYSHADLNAMATAWQDLCLHRLELIETCQLMEKPYMSDNIFTSGSLTTAAIPKEVTQLAEQLAAKHGPVTITNEASGLHIYIPDPELVQQDGIKELTSKHLAINAEKYLGIGRYDVDEYPTKENKQLYKTFRAEGKEVPCAISMKTKKRHSVISLLRMPPIERRLEGVGNISHKVIAKDPNKYLVYDEYGNLVPEWCGATTPIKELPLDHPAREYLEKIRHYDINTASDLWDICYCTEALPEDRAANRYYKRLPCDCKLSPGGRIIFPIYDDEGVRRGWQARIIDFENAHGDKFVWTDQQKWIQVKRSGQDITVSEQFPKGFEAPKYLNPRGMQRNTLMFGLQQAVAFNADKPFGQRYCVLVEGPLDAVRGGPPCIAIFGNTISQEQAALIRKNFAVIYVVSDQDAAGQRGLQRIYDMLPGANIKELTVPAGKKDLGECTYEEAKAILP